jgi:hypothetical protein
MIIQSLYTQERNKGVNTRVIPNSLSEIAIQIINFATMNENDKKYLNEMKLNNPKSAEYKDAYLGLANNALTIIGLLGNLLNAGILDIGLRITGVVADIVDVFLYKDANPNDNSLNFSFDTSRGVWQALGFAGGMFTGCRC